MRDVPDILGMELNAATALLESEGLAFIVQETKPPRGENGNGRLRVIRAKTIIRNQEFWGDSVFSRPIELILTVCRI